LVFGSVIGDRTRTLRMIWPGCRPGYTFSEARLSKKGQTIYRMGECHWYLPSRRNTPMSQQVRLYLRARLKDGSRPYLDPVFTGAPYWVNRPRPRSRPTSRTRQSTNDRSRNDEGLSGGWTSFIRTNSIDRSISGTSLKSLNGCTAKRSIRARAWGWPCAAGWWNAMAALFGVESEPGHGSNFCFSIPADVPNCTGKKESKDETNGQSIYHADG
jgi:hypothetical protein